MTIGPDPMTSTRLRSVRRGISYKRSFVTFDLFEPSWLPNSPLLHGFEKLTEQVIGVVRARRRLGMILHRKNRLVRVAETFDGAVVQVGVRDGYVRRQ